jgi:transglutaminase-like putative cysteine protease
MAGNAAEDPSTSTPRPGTAPRSRGRRLHIVHRSGYRYTAPVEASFNEVRMTPENREGQVLLSHSLQVSPNATVHSYTDYWGAFVESFDVHEPHSSLEVVATSTVDTPAYRARTAPVDWAKVHAPAVTDRWSEYLAFTTYVDDASHDPHRAEIVAQLRECATPQEAAIAAVEVVREHLAYTPGVTSVSTTASEAWEHRNGVCQDFTHVTLSLLRTLRIPARYVSGYLHTPDDAIGETVVGESHAWVEYWDGGWAAVDPTNDRAVDSSHVVVARGRDYADVPPMKGIYAGGGSESLGVSVEITQLNVP